MSQAIAIVHKSEILEQIAQGKRLTDIGAQYGISQPAISKVLAGDPEYQMARETGTLARVERWEQELEEISAADSPVMLARARELLSHARWRAEREFPARFGQKVEHSGSISPVLNISIQVASERDPGYVIEAENHCMLPDNAK